MIEMSIDSIRASLMNYQRVVILKEKMAERYLPIWIGPSEADAIAIKLQGVEVPRPLTHDLLTSVIDALGATVESVIVNDLKNDNFYAKINLIVSGGQIEVDCRPSDALALAMRVGAPIFVDEAVLNGAGILLDKESGKPVLPEGEATEATDKSHQVNKPVTKEELDRMSAFTEFINTLDFGDLDKRKS